MTTAVVHGDARSQYVKQHFDAFRTEIDEYNDRRERLIKLSRDVTTASKRLIFQLHRFPHSAFLERGNQADKLSNEAVSKRDEIVSMILKAAREEGLSGHALSEAAESPMARAQRHDRAYGPGLEEFIEAASFLHFLQTGGDVISLEQTQELFRSTSEPGPSFPVTPERYLLGISDLTGELMRFATNALGAGTDGQQVVTKVMEALRELSSAIDPFIPLVFGLRKKQTVTLQSLRKIEDLSYAVKVRTSEFASDPAALQEMVKRALAGGGRSGHDVDAEIAE